MSDSLRKQTENIGIDYDRWKDLLDQGDEEGGYSHIEDEITAISDAIIKMENTMNPGNRGERNNNPGALATRTSGYSPLIAQLADTHHLFPDKGMDTFSNDPNYSTIRFEHMADGIIALRQVVSNILFRTIYNADEPSDLKDFVSEYTGHPRESKKVHNYANEILLNLSILNDPDIKSYYDPFNKVTQEGK